jgi:hypothetical protein
MSWYACLFPGFDYFHGSRCHTTAASSPHRNHGGSDVSVPRLQMIFAELCNFCGTTCSDVVVSALMY